MSKEKPTKIELQAELISLTECINNAANDILSMQRMQADHLLEASALTSAINRNYETNAYRIKKREEIQNQLLGLNGSGGASK